VAKRWKPLVGVLLGITKGMDYMHSKRICHGDLNPSNILLKVRLHPGRRQVRYSSFLGLFFPDVAPNKQKCLRTCCPPVHSHVCCWVWTGAFCAGGARSELPLSDTSSIA
jgi:serine/threonine protein kinase